MGIEIDLKQHARPVTLPRSLPVPPAGLDEGEPLEILQWAARSVPRLSVASSFQSSGLVILHMLREIRPDVPVLFLETGFHFQETLMFKDRIRMMWDLDVVDLRGLHRSPKQQSVMYGPGLYRFDPDKCCHINKVEPLQMALEYFEAWISGLRRDQSASRAKVPAVETQELPSGKTVLKIHPLATWNKADVDRYLEKHDIPTHPLLEKGYRSIGCWPCTRPVEGTDDDERAGRWANTEKDECGIHTWGRAGGGAPLETEAEE